jgi:hypothetical protein
MTSVSLTTTAAAAPAASPSDTASNSSSRSVIRTLQASEIQDWFGIKLFDSIYIIHVFVYECNICLYSNRSFGYRICW